MYHMDILRMKLINNHCYGLIVSIIPTRLEEIALMIPFVRIKPIVSRARMYSTILRMKIECVRNVSMDFQILPINWSATTIQTVQVTRVMGRIQAIQFAIK